MLPRRHAGRLPRVPGPAMQPNDYGATERRASRRYGLQLVISYRRAAEARDNDVPLGETANISTQGMYFTTAHPVALNEVLDFTLAFPGLAQGDHVRVVGRARVLRVDRGSESGAKSAGVAVTIEEYQIIQPETAA
jgi:hypothetical protein